MPLHDAGSAAPVLQVPHGAEVSAGCRVACWGGGAGTMNEMCTSICAHIRVHFGCVMTLDPILCVLCDVQRWKVRGGGLVFCLVPHKLPEQMHIPIKQMVEKPKKEQIL